jgi:hypothetical protein
MKQSFLRAPLPDKLSSIKSKPLLSQNAQGQKSVVDIIQNII